MSHPSTYSKKIPGTPFKCVYQRNLNGEETRLGVSCNSIKKYVNEAMNDEIKEYGALKEDYGPAVALMKEHDPETVMCANCSIMFGTKTCSVCEDAKYCSKECQKMAWPLHKTVCKPYEGRPMIRVEDMGCFTNRLIEQGEIDGEPIDLDRAVKILQEIYDQTGKAKTAVLCANCTKKIGIKTCSRCLSASYCSKECQVAAWTSHKTVCKKK